MKGSYGGECVSGGTSQEVLAAAAAAEVRKNKNKNRKMEM